MEWEMYELNRKSSFVYIFYSEGPKGRIPKVIRFQRLDDLGRNTFNLAFGDLDEVHDKFDDKTVSNNGDLQKILHTVAKVVIDFLDSRPDAIILIKGSTDSRTRLYQMRIAGFLTHVIQQFEILGEVKDEWLPFQKGINYKRFLIYKKIR